MDDLTKRRVVGALVLVSLAVIFVPMVLDGEGDLERVTQSGVPPRPDQTFEVIEIPLELPDQGAPIDRVVLQEPDSPAKGATAAAPAVDPSIDEKRGANPPASSPTPMAAEPAAVAVPEARPVPKPAEPEKVEVPTDRPVTWVVQVGSFSNSQNAFALKKRLDAAGFTAFVERVDSGTGNVYRVRVGPEIKQESAEAVNRRLAKLGITGMVTPHP